MSKKLTSAGLFKALELAWDESKHKRGSKGTKQGGKFVKNEQAWKDDHEKIKAHNEKAAEINKAEFNARMEKHYAKAKDLSEGADAASAFASNKASHSVAAYYHKKAAEAHRHTETNASLPMNIRADASDKAAYHYKKSAMHEKTAGGGTKLSLVEHDDEFEDTLILSMSIADHLDVRDTKDPLTFWKEVAREGDFKKGEQDVKLRKRHFDHWANSFLEMSQIGVKVPVPLEHTKDPERRRGDVLKLVSRPNKEGVNALYAKIKFRDAEAAKLKDSGCSIFVPKEVPTGTGKVFKSAIEHICVTDYPVIPGLEPFTQAIALAFDGHQHTSQQEQEPTVANPIIEKLRTNYKQRTGVELGLTDEIAMSHLVLDSAVRIGDLDAMDVLSLEFPPKPGAVPAPPGAPPAGPPAAKPAGPPAPAAVTVRSVADALGVDPSITDEGQLLTMVLQQVTQMKARAMAAPPAAPPGMPAAPPPMPRPMAPARPPMAMSLTDLLPQEVILSLSKKQVRKLEHRLNELHVDAAIEQAELALELDERVKQPPEPSLTLSLQDLVNEIDDEPELELAMPANLLETLKHARSATVDSLFKRGIVTGAGRKMLMDRFVDGQAVALSHRHDDGFNAQVTLLEANGPVLKTKSGTGPQAVDAQVLELSNGQHGGVNPLHADADRRARGEPNH